MDVINNCIFYIVENFSHYTQNRDIHIVKTLDPHTYVGTYHSYTRVNDTIQSSVSTFDGVRFRSLILVLGSVYEPITDMYRYQPIIGFVDIENPYRYRL